MNGVITDASEATIFAHTSHTRHTTHTSHIVHVNIVRLLFLLVLIDPLNVRQLTVYEVAELESVNIISSAIPCQSLSSKSALSCCLSTALARTLPSPPSSSKQTLHLSQSGWSCYFRHQSHHRSLIRRGR